MMLMMKPGRFLIRNPDGVGVARRVELVQHEEIAPRKEGRPLKRQTISRERERVPFI